MRPFLWAGALGMLAFLAIHPEMLGVGKPEFPGWDLTRVFWADLAFARRAILEGSLPLWNPYDRGGYSFVAEPQSGLFDPLNWLLFLFALIVGAPAWLIIAKSVVCFGIAASGMFAYLRAGRLPYWAATLGTGAFILCPRLDKLKDQSALWPTVWIGWLLLALGRCVTTPTPLRGAWLGAAASMMVLTGYPPTGFRVLLLVIPLGIVGIVRALRTCDDRRVYLRQLGAALGVALVVVVSLCSAQIYATLDALPSTERVGIELADIVASPVHPRHAAGFLVPLGQTAPLLVYSGMAAALGVGLALVLRATAEVIVFAVVAVLGFGLALGDNGSLLPMLAELPGFRSFRIAGHYLILTSVGVAVLAASGLAALERSGKRWIGTGVAAAGLLAWFLVADQPKPMSAVLAVATAILVGALAHLPKPRRAWVGWVLVAVLFADLFVGGRKVADISQPYPSLKRARKLAKLVGPDGVFRMADFEWARRRPGPHVGVRDLIGHRPALTDTRYRTVYKAAPDSAQILRAMNVSVVAFRRTRAAVVNPMVEKIRGHKKVFRVADPWPFAFWSGSVRIEADASALFKWLRLAESPGVAIEEGDMPAGLRERIAALESELPPVAPKLLEQRANRLVFTVEAPDDGMFVVNESYDHNWRATVDGADAAVLRVNLIQRGVVVPAGSHEVVLEYAPPWVIPLGLLSLASWVALVAFAVRERRRESSGSA